MPKWSQVFACVVLILAAMSVSHAGGEKTAAEKQAEIKKLQKQRVEILSKALGMLTQQYKAGTTDFLKVAETHRRLLLASVELADTSDKRVKVLGELEKLADDMVKLTKVRAAAGVRGSEVDVPLAQELAIEARIELLKEEAKVAASKK